jgi:hypothetical protein
MLMRFASTFLFACAVAGPALLADAPARELLPKAPVSFEPNRGQFRSSKGSRPVLWAAQGIGYSMGFTQDATVFRWGSQAVSMRLKGQNLAAPFEPSSPLAAPTNYFTPGFRGAVNNYARLRRRQVYPGIDLVYYGNGDNLEYDFEIAPGADPSRIRMHFDGTAPVRLSAQGDLLIGPAGHAVTQRVPVVYQHNAAGARVAVRAAYRIEGHRDVIIVLGRYDATAPLVIDPTIIFEAYLFGSNGSTSICITHDSQGFIYLAGDTQAIDFGIDPNGYQPSMDGTQNAWFMKLNPAAASANQVVVYSSMYGGSGTDTLTSMTFDSNGYIYIAGYTTSTNLVIVNGSQTLNAGGVTDGFIAAFDPTAIGTAGLLYSTYYGGTAIDQILGITVFGGVVYVTGATNSTDLPVVNALTAGSNAGFDAFIAEFDIFQSGSASQLLGTYFGGSGDDYGRTILVDAAGNVYISGLTSSTNLPISPNAYQSTYNGQGDGFLSVFNPSITQGTYSTYLGGTGVDDVRKMVFDSQGRVAMTGYTSSVDFSITQNAEQPLLGAAGAVNAFLAILDLTQQPAQQLVYSTYFGGSVAEVANDLKIDSAGAYYFGGYSMSLDMPVTLNAFNPVPVFGGGLNGFVAVINPSLTPFNALRYASYVTGRPVPGLLTGPGSQEVNGVDVGPTGAIYLTGWATGDIFPPGDVSHTTATGNPEGFIWIFAPDPLPTQ